MAISVAYAFTLTASATLDHRPSLRPQVPIKPLFAQYCDECGQQWDQKACIQETGDSDDPIRWIFLNRWNDGGSTQDSGLVECEEDSAKEDR